jgi:hypothetical protein
VRLDRGQGVNKEKINAKRGESNTGEKVHKTILTEIRNPGQNVRSLKRAEIATPGQILSRRSRLYVEARVQHHARYEDEQ